MKRTSLVILVLLLQVASSPLRAEKRQEFIFEPGAGIQLSDPEISALNKNVDSLHDASAFFGFQYFWDLNPKLAVGADFNFLGDSSASRRIVSGAPTAWQTKSLIFMTVMRYYVMDTWLGKPYVLGGLGAHRTTLLADDNLTPIINSSRWGFASAIGAGIEFPARDPFILGLEGRWQFLSHTNYPLLNEAEGKTTATGGTARPSFLDLLLRLGIRF